MNCSIALRKHYLRYHRLIQTCGYLFMLLGPFFVLKTYQETQDLGLVVISIAVFSVLGYLTSAPYLFLHRLKPEGIDFGGELLRWEQIKLVEKTNNTLIFHSEDSVRATLQPPFNFLDINESLRVMADIYPPLEDKIIENN